MDILILAALMMLLCSSLNYYDVQKVNIRCKSICDQWNLLANLATERREELEVLRFIAIN